MEAIGSYSHLLNEIFSELNAASSIVISYRISSQDGAGQEKPSPILIGVNGFTSVTTFSHHLLSIKSNVLSRINEALADI